MRPLTAPRPACSRFAAAAWLALAILDGGCAARPAPSVEPPRDVPSLLAMIASPEPYVRLRAAYFLASADKAANGVADALRAALQDPHEDVREVAAWALERHAAPDGGPEPAYDVPPRVREAVKPIYPREAFDDRIEGTVEVEILIGRTGRVVYAWVIKPVDGLNEAAVRTVLQWSFEPARRNGEPVTTVALVPVTFRIY
jgi:protein TonB